MSFRPKSNNIFAGLSALCCFSRFVGRYFKIGPENETARRKFHGESDVLDTNSRFQRPEVKNWENWPQNVRLRFLFLLFDFLFGRRKASADIWDNCNKYSPPIIACGGHPTDRFGPKLEEMNPSTFPDLPIHPRTIDFVQKTSTITTNNYNTKLQNPNNPLLLRYITQW